MTVSRQGGATPASVDTITVTGSYLDRPMKVTVAVPEGYGDDTTRYPVIYLLNGHGGNYRNWPRLVPVDSIATRYQAVVVCPSGFNSWYWDSPVKPGMQMESFFIKELVPAIDSMYRTIPKAGSRAITGFSMGGHGALWLAIRHSDVFANAGATSGGVDIMPFPTNWGMYELLGKQSENRERWKRHTVMSLVDSLKPGQINMIFDCGTEDFFYKVNCNLDSALNARRIPHVYLTSPGQHNGKYWERSIYPQLDFFERVLQR
ncbi:MAG: esterase family protein [Paramuribaculum sp.]|nr:esterase family protein [Paramuribaculum sp.]